MPFRIILSFLMLLMSLNAFAWGKPTKQELVERVLVVSGTRDGIRQASRQIEQGFHAARSMYGNQPPKQDMTPEQRESMKYLIDMMRSSFNAERMLQAVASHLAANTSEEQLAKVLRMYDAPNVKRIVSLEVKTAAKMDPRTLNGFAAKLQRVPPSATRMALVDHVDRITEASSQMTQVTMDITGAFLAGNSSHLDRLRNAIAKNSKDRSLLILLYAYRDLTDRELGAYVELYQDEDFAWVVRMMSRGTTKAVTASFDNFKGSLVDWIAQQAEKIPSSL